MADLLVTQLKAAIRDLLSAKKVRARVLDKVNRYGEIVIGVIIEKQPPAPPADETACTTASEKDPRS